MRCSAGGEEFTVLLELEKVPAAAHHVRLWLLVPVGDEDALENEEDFELVALYSFTLHDGTE